MVIYQKHRAVSDYEGGPRVSAARLEAGTRILEERRSRGPASTPRVRVPGCACGGLRPIRGMLPSRGRNRTAPQPPRVRVPPLGVPEPPPPASHPMIALQSERAVPWGPDPNPDRPPGSLWPGPSAEAASLPLPELPLLEEDDLGKDAAPHRGRHRLPWTDVGPRSGRSATPPGLQGDVSPSYVRPRLSYLSRPLVPAPSESCPL